MLPSAESVLHAEQKLTVSRRSNFSLLLLFVRGTIFNVVHNDGLQEN